MEITTTEHKRCYIVKAKGRIDSLTAPKVAEAMAEVTDVSKNNIVFDMTEVDYVSSAGLRIMIDVQKTCKLNGHAMVLVGVSRRIYETLELAGFVPLFVFFDEVTAAVGSF